MQTYCKACRTSYNKEWYDKNRVAACEKFRRRYHDDPRLWMLRQARMRARQKGFVYDLTIDDISIPAICPVLGIPLVVGTGKQTDASPSLDRIDSTRGYVRGNVQVISLKANRIKNNATLSDLVKVLSHVESHVK